MMRIDFAGRESEGVFRFVPPMPAGADSVDELPTVLIATKHVREKNAFLGACASALDFPEYFGQNWDSFYDCLTDLRQKFESGLIVVFDDLSGFARAGPEEFHAALDAMVDAVDYWRERDTKLTVLIGIDQPVLAPQLPELSLRPPG